MFNVIDINKVGERIKELRKKNGLSQEKLAEKIYLTQNAISKIEKGNIKNLKLEHLVKIAECFNVSCDYLCCGKDSNSILELLEEYISFKSVNYSNGTDSYSYPVLEINKPFFYYLINSTHAKYQKNIPDNIREQWLEQEKEDFYRRIKTTEFNENAEAFIPVSEDLIYPDEQKEDWKQKDLIREINNKWSNI